MRRPKLTVMLAVVVAASGAVGLADAPAGEQRAARVDHYGDPLPEGARLGTLRFRHATDRGLNAVLLTPDGKTLLTQSGGQVYFWDVASGKRLRQQAVRARWAALSPDGKTAACIDHEDRLFLAEVSTGKEGRRLGDAADKFAAAVFSPDGAAVAAGEENGAVSLWETATGKLRSRLADRAKGAVHCLGFSRDGKRLAAASRDGCGSVWDLGTGKRLLGIDARAIALSPDGQTVACTVVGQRWICVWDVRSRKIVHELEGGRGGFFSIPLFSPDGRLLAASGPGDNNALTYVWDATSGKKRCEFPGYADAFSADSKALVVLSSHYAVRLCDPVTGKDLRPRAGHWSEVAAVAFAPDGKTLATGGEDQTLCLWDTATWQEQQRWKIRDGTADRVAFSPGGEFLAVMVGYTVDLREVATGKCLKQWDSPDDVFGCHFSSSAKVLTLACKDGTIRTWDITAGREIRRVHRHQLPKGREGYSPCAAFSPDGRLLIVASNEPERDKIIDRLGIWEADSGKMTHSLRPRDGAALGWIVALAVSPDGRLLASTSVKGDLRLWDLRAGKERPVPRSIRAEKGSALAFAPDGRWLAFGSIGHTVRLWEVAAGQEAERWPGHTGPIRGLTFAPDGRTLVSASEDGTALVWDLTAARGAAPRRTPEEMEKLWQRLADTDAAGARQALLGLAAVPEQSLPLLRERLRPASREEQKRIADWIARLDGDDFALREKTTRELKALGSDAEPALRHALAGRPSLEMRRRIEGLMESISILSPRQLQVVRAVAVLEQIATPEAQRLLETLAQGAPEALLTHEAKAARERLSKGRAAKP